jgi:Uncharacterized protein conserved in bacteria
MARLCSSYRYLLFLLCVLCIRPGLLSAQKQDTETRPSFKEAVQLYNRAYYNISRDQFLRLESDEKLSKQDREAAKGYILLCDIALQAHGLENAVQAYAWEHPRSVQLHPIYFQYAKWLFDHEKYEQALSYFQLCKASRFEPSERAELAFKTGYAAFQTGDLPLAARCFEQALKEKDHSYDTPATYYIAYISYINKDFNKAIDGFKLVAQDARFSKVAPYYILQSKFLLKQYDQVAAEGESLFAQSEGNERTGISRLLAEAFFALNQAERALPYAEFYQKNTKNLSREDNYLSGVIQYVLLNYSQAIPFLEKAALVQDALGQNAYYYLGETYVHTKNKLAALNAFRIASTLDFDPSILEDALFNYAKLSFDLYNNIGSFTTYMERYPNTARANEIQHYIADSHLLKQDYVNAIIALQAIQNPQTATLSKLQRALFLRGMQLYQSGSFRDAEALFNQVIDFQNIDNNIALLAVCRKAECLYRSQRHAEAIALWEHFLRVAPDPLAAERNEAPYNIAYAYFQLKDYPTADQWFQEFLKGKISKKSPYVADSYNRLGDGAFIERAYEKAIEHYTAALTAQSSASDYSLFQIALSQGLLFQPQKKIASLQQLITQYPNSSQRLAATFELGRSYVQTGSYSTAQTIFEAMIAQEDIAPFHSKALVELGLIAINVKQPDKALTYYKKVLELYPESPEADNALAGIENIYQERKDAKGYFEYISSLGIESGKSADEKEQMLFDSGEQLFLSGAYPETIQSLRSLLTQYPDGAKSAQAHFYIAESLYHTGKEEEASDAYFTVMRNGQGAFAEQATLQYARISYRLQKYDEAAKGYETLSEIAILENNRNEAEIGKLRTYYKLASHEQTLMQAQKVLALKELNAALLQETHYLQAKSHIALGQREQANAFLQQLARETYSPIGAESAYLLILDSYNAGQFELAEERIYSLSDSDSPQHYWIALSFIILGDIYADRDEIEQALATYQSLLDEYKSETSDNIHDIVRARIQKHSKK